MDFSDKTYENLLNARLAMVPNNVDKSEGSPIFVALAPGAYEMAQVYKVLDIFDKQKSWDTATDESLELLCAMLRGLARNNAVKATKKGLFNVEVPIGNRFRMLLGKQLIFKVIKQLADEEDYKCYELECETAGIEGNNCSGEMLAIDYVDGLNYAMLTDIIKEGSESETDENLRNRLKSSANTQGDRGNVEFYQNEITKIEGVGACQTYPAWLGGSTVKCCAISPSYSPLSALKIAEIQEEICPGFTSKGIGKEPIGAEVVIVTGEILELNIECDITVESGVPDDYKTQITEKIAEYIKSAMSTWGTQIIEEQDVKYKVTIYNSRVLDAILQVSGVVNCTNLKINDEVNDISLIENSTTQQIAQLGEVTLNG